MCETRPEKHLHTKVSEGTFSVAIDTYAVTVPPISNGVVEQCYCVEARTTGEANARAFSGIGECVLCFLVAAPSYQQREIRPTATARTAAF